MKFFEEIYGTGSAMTITTKEGNAISGLMYGNDECFNLSGFYQFFVSDGKIYECYYHVSNDDDDLGNIDYKHPYKVVDSTRRFEDVL